MSAGYEQFGIAYVGNVWVKWVAAAFILFCFYNIVIFFLPEKYPMSVRLRTKDFGFFFCWQL